MKLIIFHQHFKLPFQAGSSRMYNFATALSANGHQLTLLTGSSCRPAILPMGLTLKRKNLLLWEYRLDDNITVISISDFYSQNLSHFLRILSFMIFAMLSIGLGIKQSHFDIVFASSTPLTIAIPAIVSSWIKKRPFVFEARDLWPEAPIQLGFIKNKMLIHLLSWFELFVYKQSDAIIGISKGICKKIETKSGKSVDFISHMVDNSFFNLTKEIKPGLDQQILTVIYSGSCGFNNAIEIFINIAKKTLCDKEISAKVVFQIVGDGPALNSLRKCIPANVRLYGKIPKISVAKKLVDSDIALFSQRKVIGGNLKKDSLPNKFFDFIGAGLPIITGAVSDGEMAKQITSHGCGIVVDPEDVDALFHALKRVVTDRSLRKKMSTASRDTAALYSAEKQSLQFLSLLEKLNNTDRHV